MNHEFRNICDNRNMEHSGYRTINFRIPFLQKKKTEKIRRRIR